MIMKVCFSIKRLAFTFSLNGLDHMHSALDGLNKQWLKKV